MNWLGPSNLISANPTLVQHSERQTPENPEALRSEAVYCGTEVKGPVMLNPWLGAASQGRSFHTLDSLFSLVQEPTGGLRSPFACSLQEVDSLCATHGAHRRSWSQHTEGTGQQQS